MPTSSRNSTATDAPAESSPSPARPDGIGRVDRIVYSGMGDAPDFEIAPLHAMVAQSFALLQSLALGLTPDRPDPAGTVNRVVQGVTIHPWNGLGRDVPRR